MADKEKNILIRYFKERGIVIFISRCILMELASNQHKLAEEYIELFKAMNGAGVKVVIFNEEYI